MRGSVGLIEQEGINRALSNFAAANIRIVLFDVEELARAYGPNKGPKNPDDERMLSLLTEHRANTLIVLNKSDLVLTDEIKTVKALFDGFPVCLVSCKHGEGIDALLGELQSTVTKLFVDLHDVIRTTV
jgi:tRNA U34 5-carboxymethylaminomethyl modifying GTPase MnmE/TrmE